MEELVNFSFCPICYDNNTQITLICEFEICTHKICDKCFNLLKEHSNKCPICSLVYKNIIKKDISKNYEIVEIYELDVKDYLNIKKNKVILLGRKYYIKYFF